MTWSDWWWSYVRTGDDGIVGLEGDDVVRLTDGDVVGLVVGVCADWR